MFTFAVTAYQEMTPQRLHGQRLLRCLQAAIHHPHVSEIVVVDDCSNDYTGLEGKVAHLPKVHLYHNPVNYGVFGNKVEAVARATNDWVITCDSDNLMDAGFIDHVCSLLPLHCGTWYQPSFARPDFDYRKLTGLWSLASVYELLAKPLADCCLNTGNQVVHRPRFLEVLGRYRGQRFDLMMPNWLDVPPEQRQTEHWRQVYNAADSFILNMEWLCADNGHRFFVVPGLEYDHYRATTNEGNYVRAPKEKVRLAEYLHGELHRRSIRRRDAIL